MRMEEQYQKTLDYLRKLCSVREYCRKDIYDKALKRLEDDAAASKAVDQLMHEGFLSESRYAAAYARDKSSIAGWGPAKIRYMLAGKGIPRDVIDEALQEIDAGRADDKLRKLLAAKYKLLKDDPQVKIKMLKFALSRGYEYDPVGSIVKEILRNEEI